LRRRSVIAKGVATPSELRLNDGYLLPQGFKANPGLELANTFGVDNSVQLFRGQAGDRGAHALHLSTSAGELSIATFFRGLGTWIGVSITFG